MNSIIILCGGRGRRMGQDKGLMLFQDKPLILHVLETASTVAGEIILVLRNNNQLMEYKKILKRLDFNLDKLFLCIDIIKDQGPLMGIYTGIKNVSSNRALVVPCDSPFITQAFMKNIFYYSDDFDAIVPEWSDGRVEPLHAIYNKDVSSKIEALVKKDKRDVKSLLAILKVKYVEIKYLDKTGHSFMNLNKPEDLYNNPNNFKN